MMKLNCWQDWMKKINYPSDLALTVKFPSEQDAFGGQHLTLGRLFLLKKKSSPYITVGPGVGLYDRKLKVNLFGGLAVGKVNSIKSEFRGEDLSDMDNLTNESISEKVWDSSWFIGIGVRYKLKED